jgi:hypothetical protein
VDRQAFEQSEAAELIWAPRDGPSFRCVDCADSPGIRIVERKPESESSTLGTSAPCYAAVVVISADPPNPRVITEYSRQRPHRRPTQKPHVIGQYTRSVNVR